MSTASGNIASLGIAILRAIASDSFSHGILKDAYKDFYCGNQLTRNTISDAGHLGGSVPWLRRGFDFR